MAGDREERPAKTGSKTQGTNGISGTEFAGAGIQFAATLVAFALLGVWVDSNFGTSPWILLGSVAAGAGGGFYNLYRKLMKGQQLNSSSGDKRGE